MKHLERFGFGWYPILTKQKSFKYGRLSGLILAAVLGLVLGGGLAAASVLIPATRPGPSQRSTDASKALATAALPAAPAATSQPAGGGANAVPTITPQNRLTVLVMGVDNRPGEPVGRTDTIMLVGINPQTGQAGMVSLARDLLVSIPGRANKAKINTAHLYGEIGKYPGGGPALLRETVANFIGYRADYWVRINFDGFRQIIDQIGGVDIDVPKAMYDPTYPDEEYGYDPLYIPAGHIHMNGALALKFARTRHVDSDYGRARRQQQVILAVKDKLLQPGTLGALLPRLPMLAVTLSKSVQTDMPVNKLIDLGRMMMNQGSMNNVRSAVIDDRMGRDATDPTWGFVLIPDLKKARAAAAVAMGDALEPGVIVQNDPAIAKEGARVAVLNGTTQSDLADLVATNLAVQGYKVVGTGVADRHDYTASWLIKRGSTTPATAAALAKALGITSERVQSTATDNAADLVVIVGADLESTADPAAGIDAAETPVADAAAIDAAARADAIIAASAPPATETPAGSPTVPVAPGGTPGAVAPTSPVASGTPAAAKTSAAPKPTATPVKH